MGTCSCGVSWHEMMRCELSQRPRQVPSDARSPWKYSNNKITNNLNPKEEMMLIWQGSVRSNTAAIVLYTTVKTGLRPRPRQMHLYGSDVHMFPLTARLRLTNPNIALEQPFQVLQVNSKTTVRHELNVCSDVV
jgi:hypothetical protein